MDINEERDGDITVLTIAGDLDARTLPDALEALAEQLKLLRIRLVFNLSEIEVVTSTAVSFLIDAAKRTRTLGGDTVLSNPTRLLQHTLESLQIGDFFKVFPTDKEAVTFFRDQDLDDTASPDDEESPKKRSRWRLFGKDEP